MSVVLVATDFDHRIITYYRTVAIETSEGDLLIIDQKGTPRINYETLMAHLQLIVL